MWKKNVMRTVILQERYLFTTGKREKKNESQFEKTTSEKYIAQTTKTSQFKALEISRFDFLSTKKTRL